MSRPEESVNHFFQGAVEFKIENRDSTGHYLLRRVPPALGDPRILLHSLVSDQLLALTLQLLNLTEKHMNRNKEERISFYINLQEKCLVFVTRVHYQYHLTQSNYV